MSGLSNFPEHGAHSESLSSDAANNPNMLSLSRRLGFSTPNPFGDYHRFHGNRGADQHTDSIVVGSYPRTSSAKGGRAPDRSRASKEKKSGAPRARVSNVVAPSGGSRLDNSLVLITQRFYNLIKNSDDGVVDLTEAAQTLQVPKRRMYDVTNVLEGIGLIEKSEINKIRWKGAKASKQREKENELSAMKAEVKYLTMEERRLDEKIREMEQNVKNMIVDENSRKWLYIAEEDIIRLPEFQSKNVIAVRAPQETKLEVPHPDEGADYPNRRYKINISSSTVKLRTMKRKSSGSGGPSICLLPLPEAKESRDIEVINVDSPSREIGTMTEHSYVQPGNFPAAYSLGANESRGKEVITLEVPSKETEYQAKHTNQMPSDQYLSQIASELNSSQDISTEINEISLANPYNGLDYLFASDNGLNALNLWSRDFMRSRKFLCNNSEKVTDSTEQSPENPPPGMSQLPCPSDFAPKQ